MGGPYYQWCRPYVRVELNSEQTCWGGTGWVEAGARDQGRCPCGGRMERTFDDPGFWAQLCLESFVPGGTPFASLGLGLLIWEYRSWTPA